MFLIGVFSTRFSHAGIMRTIQKKNDSKYNYAEQWFKILSFIFKRLTVFVI